MCVGVCVCSLFCYTVLTINSSFALIPLGKRELIALFKLSSCCHATVSVPCFFLMVWLVGLQYVIVVFSGLLVLKNCAQHQDCGIFWTLSFKICAQHRRLPDFIPHIS